MRKFIWFATAVASLPLLAHADELMTSSWLGLAPALQATGSVPTATAASAAARMGCRSMEPAGGLFSFKLPAGIALPGGTSTTASSSITVSCLCFTTMPSRPRSGVFQLARVVTGEAAQQAAGRRPGCDEPAYAWASGQPRSGPDAGSSRDRAGRRQRFCLHHSGWRVDDGAKRGHLATHGSVYGADTARMGYARDREGSSSRPVLVSSPCDTERVCASRLGVVGRDLREGHVPRVRWHRPSDRRNRAVHDAEGRQVGSIAANDAAQLLAVSFPSTITTRVYAARRRRVPAAARCML